MSEKDNETGDKDPVGYRPTERDLSLEAMAEARHRALTESGDQEAGELEPAKAEAETVTAESKPAVVVAPELKAEDQVTKQMRKVKVDGEELEVSDDDLVASYQKQAAATKRLADANAEAQRIVAAAKTEAEQIKKPAAADERAAKVKEYHQALFEGDVDKATALFDEITPGRQAPIPDVKAIIDQVTPVVQQKLSNESALAKFETDYKDIVDDPYLVSVTKANLEANMAAGKPYAEALLTAGAQTRDWLKSKIPAAPAEQPTTTRAEKLDKKAGIVNFPTANAKAASTEEREQTDSEYIAEMRRKRGLG